MSRKKAGEKPLDRTQIYVALIGVIGTIIVTLITVLANRPAAAPAEPTAEPETAEASPASQGNSQSSGTCLEDYFGDVPLENRFDLTSGVSTRVSAKQDGVFGIRLFDDGNLLGEIILTGANNTKSFQVVSVIDAGCEQIFEYENLDRPDAKGSLADWENLGMTFAASDYRLRVGWYSGNQVELNFSQN
jgi:hypothetical protein